MYQRDIGGGQYGAGGTGYYPYSQQQYNQQQRMAGGYTRAGKWE
jgi:hypothetical protein